MGNPLNSDEYIGWFSHLYPSHGYPSLILVSGMIGFGLYALGSVIAAAVSVGYFKDAYPIFSAIGVIVLLVWFGWIDGSYVEAWNEVRSAFAVDDETYESVVRFRLERMYDWRRILMYSSVIAVAYFLVTTLVFVEHVPFHDTASDFIYETGDNPLAALSS